MFELGLLLIAVGCACTALGWLAGASSQQADDNRQVSMSAGIGLVVLGIVALVTELFVGAAAAQTMPPACGRDADMVALLVDRFGETEIGSGTVDRRVVVRIFASAGGATWTMASTDTAGITCLIASGNDLDIAPPPAPGERRS